MTAQPRVRRRRTWRPLRGRLWFPGGDVQLDRPGRWAWRRKRLNRKGGTDG